MAANAFKIIRDEHRALASVLRSLVLLLDQYRRDATPPDFALLRAMLFYVDEFPERLHHTKESELLFPMVRSRTRECDEALDRLDREHERGERAIRDLEHALLAYEMMGEERRDAFEQAVRSYVDFYLDHMHVEESQVLPVAERVLTEADRRTLDDAFARNRDPLADPTPDGAYRPVFLRILMNTPAPLGLGAAAA